MDIEKLEKLNELKEKGVLTEEEFNIQKKNYYRMLDNHKMCLKKHDGQDLSSWNYFVICMTKKYNCIDGRASRKECLSFIFFSYVISFVLIFLFSLLPIDDFAFNNIARIINIAFFIPNLAVLIRRMHDVNMSGRWILTLIVPLIVIFLNSDMNKNKYGEVPTGVTK